jgi:hypothetical protein
MVVLQEVYFFEVTEALGLEMGQWWSRGGTGCSHRRFGICVLTFIEVSLSWQQLTLASVQKFQLRIWPGCSGVEPLP